MRPRHRNARSWPRAGVLAVLAAACIGTGALAQDCALPGPAAEVSVSPQWSAPGKPFEGWGTALAWFANVTGRLDDPTRNRLADLLYGQDGLQLNIARYNIGGGNAADTAPYLRTGGDIPGFWRRPTGATGEWHPDDPSQWDWSADAGQRWWLDAVRDRVPASQRIFEAFSNSPPYFMTVSGRVSGHVDGLQDNLRAGDEGLFAGYLVRVTQELEARHHIVFRTLSPVNEPNTPYWHADNRQEGAHWSPARQSAIITAVAAELAARKSDTQIAAIDETNAQTFVVDWAGLDKDAIAAITQINVHSYDTTGKTAVRDIARMTGKRLWMSEVDLSPPNVPEDFNDMRPAIALGEQIVSDMNRLQPVAWVLWQAVEDTVDDPRTGGDWGLIKMDLAHQGDPDINITRKYWALANFTKSIRPGDRFVPVDDTDTVVAVKPDNRAFVMVHVNPGLYPRRLKITMPQDGDHAAPKVAVQVTDGARNFQTVCSADLNPSDTVLVPPLSIATINVTR